MRYKTPAAHGMAVKEAAKKSPLDANRAIAGFYLHRLLCRVFSDPDSPFVLKGGQSVLARNLPERLPNSRCLARSVRETLREDGKAGEGRRRGARHGKCGRAGGEAL